VLEIICPGLPLLAFNVYIIVVLPSFALDVAPVPNIPVLAVPAVPAAAPDGEASVPSEIFAAGPPVPPVAEEAPVKDVVPPVPPAVAPALVAAPPPPPPPPTQITFTKVTPSGTVQDVPDVSVTNFLV
jgi:hypothetical protein